jgi:hypothetical protein
MSDVTLVLGHGVPPTEFALPLDGLGKWYADHAFHLRWCPPSCSMEFSSCIPCEER